MLLRWLKPRANFGYGDEGESWSGEKYAAEYNSFFSPIKKGKVLGGRATYGGTSYEVKAGDFCAFCRKDGRTAGFCTIESSKVSSRDNLAQIVIEDKDEEGGTMVGSLRMITFLTSNREGFFGFIFPG